MSGYGYWLAPIAALMLIDYYVIKRGNLSLPDLFTGNPSSRYWFNRGVNYRATGTVVIALIPCLPSFAYQIADDHLGFGTTARSFFYISFVFTYTFAALLYWVSFLVFPEKGECGSAEKGVRFEQRADENDELEREGVVVGIVEEGRATPEEIADEKKVGAINKAVEV